MRHRLGMAAQTGLGNSAPVLLNNKGELTKDMKAMMTEAMSLWKPLEYGVDYQLLDGEIHFGREPAYQYEELFIIGINKVKDASFILTGKAFDSWGSGIRSRVKSYMQFKNKSKFVRFIDKWQPVLFVMSHKQEEG